jgi:hypothetical protein
MWRDRGLEVIFGPFANWLVEYTMSSGARSEKWQDNDERGEATAVLDILRLFTD